MNDFGIRSAIRACMTVYEGASRGSGRTTRTIDAMQEGDVFVTINDKTARYVQGLARLLGKNISVLTVPKDRMEPRELREWVKDVYRGRDPRNRPLPHGIPRTLGQRGLFLDHLLILQLYENAADSVYDFLHEVTEHKVDPRDLADPALARPIGYDSIIDLGPRRT
jgi:hypothetical protein